MRITLQNEKSSRLKYSIRFVDRFPIDLPAEKIDLYKWIIEMTESNYISYAPAHIAMNSYFKDGILFMTNVENIGMDTVVQHYELKYQSAEHVLLYSLNSEAYIMRWIGVAVGVPWEMQIRAITDSTCELICLIGVDYPSLLLKAAAWVNGLGGAFLKKRLRREGNAFARDIEQKFKLR